MHIALATNQEYPNLLEGEVLPLEAFSKAGYDAEPAVWNDPSVDWGQFGHIIIRCCWGYHRKVEEFYSWLDKLGALGVTVHNPPEIVRWNSHKRYLLDLQSMELPVPETTLVSRSNERFTILRPGCHQALLWRFFPRGHESGQRRDQRRIRSAVPPAAAVE